MQIFRHKMQGLRGWRQAGSGRSLGLDINPSSVRLLELNRSDAGFRVAACGIEPLPEDAVSERGIHEVQAVGAAIMRLAERTGARARQASAAVAGSVVVTRSIKVPAGLSEDEMEIQLQIDAPRQLPIPLNEAAIDFTALKTEADSTEDRQVELLVTACPAKQVALLEAAIEAGGLRAAAIDTVPFCMQRAWYQTAGRTDELVAIVDTGVNLSILTVLNGSRLPYTRELPLGSRHLAEAAESGRQEDYETAVLAPFRKSLVQQIDIALQLFFSASGCDDVDQMVLAGDIASLNGLSALVASTLGMPCSLANPFSRMPCAANVDEAGLLRDAPAMMTAFGLAARGIK